MSNFAQGVWKKIEWDYVYELVLKWLFNPYSYYVWKTQADLGNLSESAFKPVF